MGDSRGDSTGPTWRLSLARSFLARFRGLMGRRELPSGEGLFLPGTNSIHMLFMRFAIDCVFVGAPRADGARQVVGIRERLAPWRGVVWWVRGARGAIEVPAGAVREAGLHVGDLVWFTT
jgi:uncharacterized protein